MSYDDSHSRAQQARNDNGQVPSAPEAETTTAASTAAAVAGSKGGAETSAPIPAAHGRAKGGAPARNVNAQAHGVWSFLALGRLPKGASYIRRLMGELRTKLEQAVVATHGEVSLGHAATITTVCRHEGRALLLSRYLALEGDGLKLLERMSMLEAIGRASDARDKAIKALGFDRDTTTDWYDDYLAGRTGTPAAITHVSAPPSSQEATPAENACNSVLEHQNGDTPQEATP